MKELLDVDGENRAVRSFLMWYGATDTMSVGLARDHMRRCGWNNHWPKFIEDSDPATHLTKAGAQLWIRYLFALENEKAV